MIIEISGLFQKSYQALDRGFYQVLECFGERRVMVGKKRREEDI
jgi:hypothetical protein